MKKTILLLIGFMALFVVSCSTTEKVTLEDSKQIENQNNSIKKQKDSYVNNGVQVINQEAVNLEVSEAAWLPGQIQDKLKSNLQEYLGMKIIVDSKSEEVLKKLQAESESEARDEDTAIELGKITTAKYALFTKIRKTGNGYTVSADFTDLTTGEQIASVTSKEYSKAEYLYGTTGAADEITLGLGTKLNIELSGVSKNLLTNGPSNFSLDDELVLAKEKDDFKEVKKNAEKDLNLNEAIKAFDDCKKFSKEVKESFVKIPGENFAMMKTEVTQKLYKSIMGSNPSFYGGDNNPVESVSWYDAIYFCNKLSEQTGLSPVYSVEGKTDVNEWNYIPHKGNSIEGEIRQDTSANGFRLPTEEEWEYAARGGEAYKYSGSDNLDEVGWYNDNSGWKTHSVGKKKANGYGLYDMSGNVWEWCWDVSQNRSISNNRKYRGGSYYQGNGDWSCEVDYRSDYCSSNPNNADNHLGFRIVCSDSD